ncbi:HlyD family type I secretion periplasmic adaptor subunit [Alsobacter sp. R-9]
MTLATAHSAEVLLGRSMRRHLIVGVSAVALLFGAVGGWAATTEFSGAVVAAGQVVVDTAVKKVQHPTGGIVGDLRVRDGDRVRAGDVVLRLDDTITRASLAIVVKSLNELQARLARLEAERDGRDALAVPAALVPRAADDEVAQLLMGESVLLRLRHDAREGQKAQLRDRSTGLKQEVEGLSNQIEAKGRELTIIQSELAGVRDLYARNLVQLPRLTQLEREAVRLEGERGQLIASAAQAREKISETALQILQIDQDLRSEVAKEIRDVQGKIAELGERKVAAEDQLKRVDLRAPQDGVVHQLAVHTVGGVINAGEPVMLIVPEADRLTVEAKIAPHDINNVRAGQPAFLRFSAFSQRTTPELDGSVVTVSADVATDQRSGSTYYTARVALSSEADRTLDRLQMRLVPGMPVEVYVQTSSRTVLSYFVKPLEDQIRTAFRTQ